MSATAPRDGQPWTAEEDATLRAGGALLAEIAAQLGRSYDGVRSRWKRLRAATPEPARSVEVRFPQWRKPAPALQEVVERECLSCRKQFRTTRFVRVCPPCKKSEAWS
jgi:hypothetical protein